MRNDFNVMNLINTKLFSLSRVILLVFLCTLPLTSTGCRVPFGLSVFKDVPCSPGTYVKKGEYSDSFLDRAKQVKSNDFMELRTDGTFFIRDNVGGPLFMEVDGVYTMSGDRITLIPAEDLNLPKNTGIIYPDSILDSDNVMWTRLERCSGTTPPAPPPDIADEDRERLVEEIEKMRDSTLRRYDHNIDVMAREYGSTTYYRNSLKVKIAEWGGMIVHALNMSVGFVGSAITLDEFFSNQSIAGDPAKLSATARSFSEKVKLEDPDIQLLQGAVFVAGLSGSFEDLDQFELYTDPLDDHSAMADEFYREHDGDGGEIADSMRSYLEENRTITIHSRNGKSTGRNPEVSDRAGNLNEGREKIEDRYNDLLDNLPDPLPAGFPVNEIIAQIDRLQNDATKFGSHVVEFQAVPADGTVETRRVYLGVLDDYEDLQLDLMRAFEEDRKVQQKQVLSDGIDLELSAISAYSGGVNKQIIDGVSLGKGTGELVAGITLIDNHEVRPISAMNANEVVMALKLGEQESNLWTMSDGICSYVNFMAQK